MVGQNKERNCAMNKILIIDDDRELCALIKRSVQSEHIEADFCNTGKEGLQKLKDQEYQLVVLDVMMPGMDGFETLEEIRKENSLPILMFTSKNDSISKVRGLRAGADDYLTKPFDMDELIARIVSLIRRYTRFNQQAGAVQKLDFDGLQMQADLKIQYRISAMVTGNTLLKKNALIASLLVIGKTSFRSSIIQDAGSYAQRLSEKIIQVHAAAVVSVPLERPAAHPHSA